MTTARLWRRSYKKPAAGAFAPAARFPIHLHFSFGCGRITVSRPSTCCGHLFAGPGGGFALFQVALQHGEVFAEKPLKFRDGRILPPAIAAASASSSSGVTGNVCAAIISRRTSISFARRRASAWQRFHFFVQLLLRRKVHRKSWSASHIGCAVFPQGSATEAHFLRLPAERSADIVPRILKITFPASLYRHASVL